MRSIMIVAAVVLAVGVALASLADSVLHKRAASAPPQAMAAAREIAPVQSDGRTVVVGRDPRGHFKVDARVDGRSMTFMVDTGASVIALRKSEAARLGIFPVPNEFTARVSTANGDVHAAPTELGRVEVGGLSVSGVAALVLPDEALSENLLGLSFLSRLRRFEYADGKLVLEN